MLCQGGVDLLAQSTSPEALAALAEEEAEAEAEAGAKTEAMVDAVTVHPAAPAPTDSPSPGPGGIVAGVMEMVAGLDTGAGADAPPRPKHVKFGCLSTSGAEARAGRSQTSTEFAITFRAAPLLDRSLGGGCRSVIGQVLDGGGDVLQAVEVLGSTTGEPRKRALPAPGGDIQAGEGLAARVRIVQCGRLPAMSRTLEADPNELLDASGKNISQTIN